jgi:hypothetical protein
VACNCCAGSSAEATADADAEADDDAAAAAEIVVVSALTEFPSCSGLPLTEFGSGDDLVAVGVGVSAGVWCGL